MARRNKGDALLNDDNLLLLVCVCVCVCVCVMCVLARVDVAFYHGIGAHR